MNIEDYRYFYFRLEENLPGVYYRFKKIIFYDDTTARV